MKHAELSNIIIGTAIEIHTKLGPGLLEHVYKECLYYLLRTKGLHVIKELPLPVYYDKIKLECGFRIDLLVENQIVLEIKSVESLHKVHFKQLMTYLKLGNYPLGFLINFNELLLKSGLKRMVNGY